MKSYDKIKRLQDGRAMLNLGCGARTHLEWTNVDFSPYARLAHHRQFTKFLNAVGILSDLRLQNLLKISPDIIHWDIRSGVPFDDNLFDVVYHSHFITHIDLALTDHITRECYRALKPGGVLRVVVPDLLKIVRMYNEAVEGMEKGDSEAASKHKKAVDDLFELMVRKDPVGTSKQKPLIRLIERIVRHDINRRGELRRWHYDKYSMGTMLRNAGFRNVRTMGPAESYIEGWNQFGLDLNVDGSVYKLGSLYMEGVK